MRLVDQEIIPRRHWGSDWGRPLRVLARQGQKVLAVWPGHNVGNRFFNRYHRTSLVLLVGHRDWSDIELSGTVAKTLVAAAERINRFFGRPVAAKIDPKKTLLIPERRK